MARRYGAQRLAKDRGRAALRAQYNAERQGAFGAEAHKVAIEQRRRQQAARRAAGLAARAAPAPGDPSLWLPLGPTTVLAGQAGGRPRVAGRVRELRVSKDGVRVYAATANGGLWYSRDGGENWQPLGAYTTSGTPPLMMQSLGVLVCGCLHVNFDDNPPPPNTEPQDEVLIGTGELRAGRSGTPGGKTGGIGVLRAVAPAAGNAFQVEATNLAGLGLYRLAEDPSNPGTFVAATSGGLYTRSGGPQANWTKVSDALVRPGSTHPAYSDVAWVKGAGGIPDRLWVAVIDDTNRAMTDVCVSDNGVAGPFTVCGISVPAATPNRKQRLSVAAAPSDPSRVYALGNGNTLWRIDYAAPAVPPAPAVSPNARTVSRVPPNLLGGQDDYNQAIAVHPTLPDRLVLGGATELADGQWSASLYLGDITLAATQLRFAFSAGSASPVNDATFIGNGVHADVHHALFAPTAGGLQLWVGCDGGVYRSLRGGDPPAQVRHSFVARNNGMSTLQCGYVATHPGVAGYVLAGTQDNGTIERIGVNLWRVRGQLLGDGGAVVFNPVQPRHILAQYVSATWNTGGTPVATTRPVLRKTGSAKTGTPAEQTENSNAGSYSGADAIANGTGALVAIGTHRVWLSSDWGARWRTLPSRTDPMANPQNLLKDACVVDSTGQVSVWKSRVLACRFGSATRLYVLCNEAVLFYDLVANTRKAIDLIPPPPPAVPQGRRAVASPGQLLPSSGSTVWSDLAVQNVGKGTFGSVYVATTGDPNLIAMDTLWWFDGTSQWIATNLRSDVNGTPAPAYAVCVDPGTPNTVYVGTAVGVWKGTFDGSAGPWTWEDLNNGLPEAAVEDLQIHTSAAGTLLRAALRSGGIWELDLSNPNVTARTYVRVHGYDTRREPVVGLTDPLQATPNAALSWHASPDLVIRPKRGSKPPAPTGLPWHGAASDRYALWVLQTALHGRGGGDSLVKPDGNWTQVFEARLAAATGGHRVTQTVWNNIVGSGGSFPDAFADPWNGLPMEADLFELVLHRKPPASSAASIGIAAVPCQVHVQVHHRHPTAVPSGSVRVALLIRRLGVQTAPTTATQSVAAWAAQNCPWTADLAAFLNPSAGPLPTLPLATLDDSLATIGTRAAALGWAFADAASPVRALDRDIDVSHSGCATFEVDLTGLPKRERLLLVAVVHSSVDRVVLPANPTLQALVLGARFVAARSLEIMP